MKLVQFIISRLPAEKVYSDHSVDLSKMVILFSPRHPYDVFADVYCFI